MEDNFWEGLKISVRDNGLLLVDDIFLINRTNVFSFEWHDVNLISWPIKNN